MTYFSQYAVGGMRGEQNFESLFVGLRPAGEAPVPVDQMLELVENLGLSFVAKSYQTANAAQTYAVALPDEVLPGDLIVVIAVLTSGGGSGLPCYIDTSGYTTIVDNIEQTTGYRAHLTVGWKFAVDGDTSVNITVGSTSYYKSVTAIYVFRNANTTTPIDVTPVITLSGAPTCPAVTPVTPGAIVLMVASAASNSLQSDATPPVIFENAQAPTIYGAGTSGSTCLCGTIDWDGDGAVGPESWTGMNPIANWAAASFAIRPK